MEAPVSDWKTFLTIAHLIGVTLGAGGAYMSDLMFVSSVRDRVLTGTELRFLRLGSRLVWIGVVILILSGVGLFSLDVSRYLISGKFLAKQSIVLIIVVNGLIFHRAHLPLLHRHVRSHFPSSDEFVRRRTGLLVSGLISLISWTSALILGGWHGLTASYTEIMTLYIILIGLGVAAVFFLKHRFLPDHRGR